MLNQRCFLRFLLAFSVAFSLVVSLLYAKAFAPGTTVENHLPFDNTNLVIYDNDWTNDYVDWYLMALASAGDINYLGISTSSSIPPYNRYMTESELEKNIKVRSEIVHRGRKSGLRNVPDPVTGTQGHLKKPASGRIADTRPLDSPGSRQIIRHAHRRATAEKPLVICVGGPLTVAANAYLMDNTIADKLIVAFVDGPSQGMYGYNGWSDGWAAYIVLQKLRLVQFTGQSESVAQIPKKRLLELPESLVRDFMIRSTPDVAAPEGDADGPPAISLMRPDFVKKFKRVSFGGWRERDGHEMPIFRDDPCGRAIVVTEVDRSVATEEWFRAMKNPQAWHAN